MWMNLWDSRVIMYSSDRPKQNGMSFPDLLYHLIVIHIKNFTNLALCTCGTKYAKIICGNVTFFFIRVPTSKLKEKNLYIG